MKPVKLVKHLANLGYGSRREVTWMFREGRITDAQGDVLYADDQVEHDAIRVDDEPLDPPPASVMRPSRNIHDTSLRLPYPRFARCLTSFMRAPLPRP